MSNKRHTPLRGGAVYCTGIEGSGFATSDFAFRPYKNAINFGQENNMASRCCENVTQIQPVNQLIFGTPKLGRRSVFLWIHHHIHAREHATKSQF